MGIGAVLEPLVVVTLLFGGAWINRDSGFDQQLQHSRTAANQLEQLSFDYGDGEDRGRSRIRASSPSLLPSQEHTWRHRKVSIFGWSRMVYSPNTAIFRNRFLSRVLQRFPFLVEAWYWALIYWVYQLGRAFTALTIVDGTVNVARQHALQLIELEQQLGIFRELAIQQSLLQYPTLMKYVNWLYSFIHIPGTIAFLVWLYYHTITSNKLSSTDGNGAIRDSASGPGLFEARRRTMAICNLMAFVIFTAWPCMPPRLLSDPEPDGHIGDLARSFGFVDTVHGTDGAVSVWTANKFCNQWAAMPSLHFGYSLLVGFTIMTIPLAPHHRRSRSIQLPFFNQSHPQLAPKIRLPSSRRLGCLGVGTIYPFAILVAIVATANHFILDAVAGAAICAIGWHANDVLLNLLPMEDWFLWCLRIHKPCAGAVEVRFSAVDFGSEKLGSGMLHPV